MFPPPGGSTNRTCFFKDFNDWPVRGLAAAPDIRFPQRPALCGGPTDGGIPLAVFSQHSGILVASVVVFEGNLGLMKERGSKNKGMLALIEDKQRLVIDYPSN